MSETLHLSNAVPYAYGHTSNCRMVMMTVKGIIILHNKSVLYKHHIKGTIMYKACDVDPFTSYVCV